METATLAGGCFWCTEAIFKRLKGVEKVTPGYSGGEMESPSYEAVSSGRTKHAEAIQLEFDPKVISFEKLLEVFFHLHDPTTMNQQGADVGTQYRSVIFYHDDSQKKTAENVVEEINKSGMYKNKVVTELSPFENFYKAEDYHLDYYAKNPSAPYCQVVIDPKITKLYREFGDIAKKDD
ncbi:MAG TPA: peptide-methionine (S)-S-oxide reductase MsrA [Candidatus Saccharimonadales bacterium]|nr:peptide-methionine (S)-S-oxide reductase MsrA [Candidatus Saccharimonadales bacterium]